MYPSNLQYFPVTWPFLLVLLALFAVAVTVVATGLVRFASASMGISAGTMLTVLLPALLGSSINIPVAYLPERTVRVAETITFFGVPYVIPVMRELPSTVIAVNVGGAVIPALLSVYLVVKSSLYGLGLVGIAIVAVMCHLVAPITSIGGAGKFDGIFVTGLLAVVYAGLGMHLGAERRSARAWWR